MSIISFFVGLPYANYFFAGSKFLSFLGAVNILAFIGVPLLALIMYISKYVFKTRVSPNFKAGMWSFWIVNVISLFGVGSYQIAQFSGHAKFNEVVDISQVTSDTLRLDLSLDPHRGATFGVGNLKLSDEKLISRHIHLNIVKSEGDQFELVQEMYSRGRTQNEALRIARAISYDINVSNDAIVFPRIFAIASGNKWRNQQITYTLKVPEGKAIQLEHSLWPIRSHLDIDRDQEYPRLEEGQTWLMESNGLINKEFLSRSQRSEEFDFKDFHTLQIEGRMKVTVEKGDQFKIDLNGKPHYLDKVELVQLDKTLNITSENKRISSPIRLNITLPELKELSAMDTDDIKIQGFSQKSMRLKHEGKYEMRVIANLDSLLLTQSNYSSVTLKGKGTFMDADMDKRTNLDADRFSLKNARINAGPGAKAKVAVSDSLWRVLDGSSRIKYDGSPVLIDKNAHDQE